MGPLEAQILDTEGARDLIPEVVGEDGRMRVLPAIYWAGTTPAERGITGHRLGVYSFPTTELVNYLHRQIGGRKAIEVGAGHGVLADALGIIGTDSMIQAEPAIQALYAAHGQPVVEYGPNVQRREALAAVKLHKPKVVIACWVTHRWSKRDQARGGNMFGPDLPAIIRLCETFIFIGNRHVHRNSPIWRLPHTLMQPPWLYSRATNGTPDFIAVFGKNNEEQLGEDRTTQVRGLLA